MDAPIRKTFHEVDLLKSTFLTPPQAVLLARELGRSNGKTDFPLLTPEEVAQVFCCRSREDKPCLASHPFKL